MNTFLPEGYKAPEGQYYKLADGENTFRIMTSAVTGYEYWNTENKAVRSKSPFKLPIQDIKLDEKTGKPTLPKHFWAFAILAEGAVMPQIMQISQKSIQNAIRALVENAKWGDPKGYDITITKTGSNLTTEYAIMPNPHSKAVDIDVSNINLEALFNGTDPFAGNSSMDELQTDLKKKK